MFVDFDEMAGEVDEMEEAANEKQSIELEEAVQILKLLKAVKIKGL